PRQQTGQVPSTGSGDYSGWRSGVSVSDKTEKAEMKREFFRSALAALAATTGMAPATMSAAGLERIVLRNGLEVILVRKTGIPLVTVEIAIRAGAFIETPEL